MAHYALLDENNIVVQVIVGNDESEGTDWESYYSNATGKTCTRTSYNSRAGNHPEGAHCCFRKNYAGIGYSYNQEKDAFIPPQPYNSWVLCEDTCCWKAPVEQPEGVSGVFYTWDENIMNWKEIKLT
jgi:hypothetical protein